MARRVLDSAGRSLVAVWVVEGDSNAAILEKLAAAGYPSINESTLTFYRRKLFPETVARDLEAIQGAKACFQARVSDLLTQIRALSTHAITPEGNLSSEKDSVFSLKVAAELARELSSILKQCDDRFFRLEKLELEKAANLRAEAAERRAEAAEKRAAERWEIEKGLINREMILLDREEAASVEELDEVS